LILRIDNLLLAKGAPPEDNENQQVQQVIRRRSKIPKQTIHQTGLDQKQ
jgi:uncharacterized protein (DUF342 family)